MSDDWPREITVGTRTGDLLVREEELATLTEAEMAEHGLPERLVLCRLFADGMDLMKGRAEGDKVRPVVEQTREGSWKVLLVEYSPTTDPLINVRRPKGSGDH